MTWMTRLISFLKSLFGGKQQADAAAPTDRAPAPNAAPAPVQPAVRNAELTARDYADSFFSGRLAGEPMPGYTLPAGARGYGAGGAYDTYAFDPAHYDSALGRILASDGGYIDVATCTRHYPDGSTERLPHQLLRQYLYGLSIDPASASGLGLLAHGLLSAPRSIGRAAPGQGQGAFGA